LNIYGGSNMNRLKKGQIITALTVAVMVLGVFAVLEVASQPAYAASGSISMDPTVFSSGMASVTLVNGGTFGSGATVTFYISTTDTFTSRTSIGTYSLTAGTTTLSNAVLKLAIPAETPGQYYIAASDDGGSTFTAAVPVTVSSLSPKITVSSPVSSGSTATVTGTGFDVGSAVDVYLSYPSGPLLIGDVNATSGSFSAKFTVPASLTQSNNPFYVVAQETSSSSTNYGITADGTFTLAASIVVSPRDISPSVSSTVTIYGYGFYANSTISANSISLSPATGSISAESNSAVTVSPTGSFTVSVTFTSIGASGPVSITVTTSPASSPSLFPSSFFISQPNPADMKFSFSVTPTYGSVINTGDAVTATVYNFPSSQSVKVTLGGVTVGTVTTDSNGYASFSSTVPAIPSGTYSPTAYVPSLGLYSQASSVTISPFFEVRDPSGTLLNSSLSEYVPSTGILTLIAYGLTPSTLYDPMDSLSAPSGIFASGLETSVSVGAESLSGIYPAYNGTVIFSYVAKYPAGTSTSTPSTISVTGVSGYGGNSFGYRAVGTAVMLSPSAFGILLPGSPATLTLTGLIPYGSAVYPGLSYYYNAYLGSNELTLTFSSTSSKVFYGTSGTFTGSFIVPSISGINNLSITMNGKQQSSAVGGQYTIESVPGTSPSSGTIVVIPVSSGYEVVGYGYYLAPTVYYMTYAGRSFGTTVSLTDGAFSVQIYPGNQPSGTYSVFTEVTSSGVNYFVYSSYSVFPVIKVTSPSKTQTGQYEGPVGTAVSITLTGLNPDAYYNITFGKVLVKKAPVETDGTGTISSFTFYVPALPEGIYNISATQVGQTSPVVTVPFNITENSNIELSTSSQYAFPGEIVQFAVGGLTPPSISLLGVTPVGSPSYSVTVALNGTNYETVPALYSSSGNLTGSFLMPNSNPGSYYALTFTANETQLVSYTISTSTPSTGYTMLTLPFTGNQTGFLGLAQGNGALLTGISPSQIATIIVDVTGAVKTSMQVPLSELNASVVSINNAVATIKTAFGNMTATLSSLNASVSAIKGDIATVQTSVGNIQVSLSSLNASIAVVNAGIVTLQTSVGKVQTSLNNLAPVINDINGSVMTIGTTVGNINMNLTEFGNMIVKAINNGTATVTASINGMNVSMQSSLSAINAKLVALNGNVATINTTLGQVTTTLSSINLEVTNISGGVATIQTDLGTFTGSVKSVSDGIATIETSLGTIKVNVGNLKSSVTQIQNYGLILDVVLIALVAVTLGIAVGTFLSTRDMKKRFGMKKE